MTKNVEKDAIINLKLNHRPYRKITIPHSMGYNLLLFSFTIIVISLIPGLNVMLVVSQSIQRGLKRSTASIAGIVAGNLIYFAVSILGLGALLMRFPETFKVIKFAGVAFTLYSAWSLLKLGLRKDAAQIDFVSPGNRNKDLFQGMLTIISNPKAFIFWITVLPGFVDPQQGIIIQVAVFGVVAIMIDTMILFGYGYLATSIAPLLERKSQSLQFLISGAILALVAVWLVFS
jgi:homoserine/homoserine lactone efflux protein